MPSNLKCIIFGHSFNHILKKGILPESLNMISFSVFYNHYLEEGVLPKSLKESKLPLNELVKKYNKQIKNLYKLN